ncbi:tyrosine-type recombinase/integrase [Microbacterium sp. KNMS]
MPRPPLILETWGKIRRATINGQPIAYAYYRDSTGRRRQMQRNGRTEAAAERNLIEALKAKLSTEADLLSSDSTIADLADKHLEELRLKKTPHGTYNTYRTSIESKIKPGIGQLRLREATVPRLDRFLKDMMVTPSQARTARTVLVAMFKLAVRQGAVSKNPAQDTMPISPTKRAVKVISLEDIHALRRLFADYDANHTSELFDLSSLLMATGCRIGEALAIRWEDIDLEAGILRITGTLVQSSETGKLIRQDHPKSEAGHRGLKLPATLLGTLTERRVNAEHEKLFPSSTGTWKWPANARRQWRDAIADSVYKGRVPKDFRRAVATHLDRKVGLAAAAAQLGHGSEDITVQYYVEREKQIANFAEVIDSMFESAG